jgi:D-beta-D-heptose 7-phosphate kinase/D-beta-D-heptose 1-phosphate adenosyltransferase
MSGSPAALKVAPIERARERIDAWRVAGERVVLASGVFELLEVAHVRRLAAARTPGTRLVVVVLGDRATAARLGPGRPVVGERDRALLVAALRPVDLVIVSEEPDAVAAALRTEAGMPDVERVDAEPADAAAALIEQVRRRHGGA